MQTVWKFDVPVADTFELEMPIGARLLAFHAQNGKPVLWALVDTDMGKRTRRFRLAGTGHPLDAPASQHIGTCQLQQGTLVLHLFEVS